MDAPSRPKNSLHLAISQLDFDVRTGLLVDRALDGIFDPLFGGQLGGTSSGEFNSQKLLKPSLR